MPPLVLAYHLIITAYGFWLPNDPRGSWCEFVRAWELFIGRDEFRAYRYASS